MYKQLVSTAQLYSTLSDDEVDAQYACNHNFLPFQMAEGYCACIHCGQVMWMVMEMAYCNWQGKAVEGNV